MMFFSLFCPAAKPYATTIPDVVTARRGDAMHVQCVAHGSHPITYQWTRVGRAVLSSKAKINDGLLTISPLKVTDSGTYKCVATNHIGTSEAFTTVTVKGEAEHYLCCFMQDLGTGARIFVPKYMKIVHPYSTPWWLRGQ